MHLRMEARMAFAGLLGVVYLTSSLSQAVVDGDIDKEQKLSYVVAIHLSRGGENGMCTGVLVSPVLVLTAAHCLSEGWKPSRVTNAVDAFRRRHQWGTTKFAKADANPEFMKRKPAGTKSNLSGGGMTVDQAQFDFAYILLQEPAPPQISPALLAVIDARTNYLDYLNKPVLLAGYGMSDFKPSSELPQEGETDNQTWGTRRSAQNQVAQSDPRGLLTFSDAPPTLTLAKGDSGGGVFDRDQKSPTVFAINIAVSDSQITDGSGKDTYVRNAYALMLQPHLLDWLKKSSGWDWKLSPTH